MKSSFPTQLFAAILCLAACRAFAADAPTREIQCQVCIVGGGSGGFGAALAASRAGADVILIEQNARLGGTSTSAYVNSWEPGPGDSFARELYDTLKKSNAVGVTSDANPGRRIGPFGLWQINPDLDYDASLRRAGVSRGQSHGVVFDPDAMSALMAELLARTGKCRVMLKTRFVSAESQGARVKTILAQTGDGAGIRITAKVFIDSTGDVVLCRAAGCQSLVGVDPRGLFNEPGAPEESSVQLNGISWCYRIRQKDNPAPAAAPTAPVKSFPRSAHTVELPGGDRIINPLGLLPGEKLLDLGYDKLKDAALPVVQAHWQWLQKQPAFAKYEFVEHAAMLGIRESWRVVGEYVLTQHDLTDGLARQKHPDIIALADHAIDVHGSGRASLIKELTGPYGIPYRCLIPKGKDNLLVACRGAGFSHIAASSCRLSRTMISLGHAAGLGAAQAAKNEIPVGKVDVEAIRREMRLAK